MGTGNVIGAGRVGNSFLLWVQKGKDRSDVPSRPANVRAEPGRVLRGLSAKL